MSGEKKDACIRRKYIHTKIDQLIEKGKKEAKPIENIHTFGIKYETDHTGHPTEEGAKQILTELDRSEVLNPDLIWNENYITNDRLYRGVQSVFKYGCNGCMELGMSISHEECEYFNTCDRCLKKINEVILLEDLSLI